MKSEQRMAEEEEAMMAPRGARASSSRNSARFTSVSIARIACRTRADAERALAAVGARTSRIEIGTGVIDMRYETPLQLAEEAAALDLLAELQELRLADPSLEEGTGVDAGRGVALDVDQIPAMLGRGSVPEMHEAGVVEGGRRLEARDVAAQLGAFLVGAEHDGQGVPADQRADLVFDRPVARVLWLLLHRDGVDVGRGRRERHPSAPLLRRLENPPEQEAGPVSPLDLQDTRQRIQPLAGLDRINVAQLVHNASPLGPMRPTRMPMACPRPQRDDPGEPVSCHAVRGRTSVGIHGFAAGTASGRGPAALP